MARVVLENVSKNFGKVEAVKSINLEVNDKEFLILVGPSGCGKSTILRMIVGLDDATSGNIYIDGRLANDVAPKERNIAMVFQDYALYPHMTVYQNMGFALKLKKMPKAQIDQRAREAAEILGIQDLLDRKPRELSGGQRQRAALGRAIVRKPAVFLFDEPLSNLDAKLRTQMRAELSKLHEKLKTTIIYVTHDQVEAMTMGSKIVVMKDGEIQQVNTPMRIYEYPVNMFVAGFIGSPAMNFIPAKINSEQEGLWVDAGPFRLPLSSQKQKYLQGIENQKIILGVRPEDIQDRYFAEEEIVSFSIHGIVDVIEPLGHEVHLNVNCEGYTMVARVDPRTQARLHQEIELNINLDKIHIFESEARHRRIKTE